MISSGMEKLKDAAWGAACFGQLVAFIVHALLGVRLLVLPAMMLAQDLYSPAAAQQQIEGLQADLRRHERKIDGLTSSVHELGVELAVLSQHIEDAEESHDKAHDRFDWSGFTLLGLLGLLGERGFAKWKKG